MNFSTLFLPKNLLMLDAAGALLSAVLLGCVLVQFEQLVGVPRRVLYYLAAWAAACALLSAWWLLYIRQKWATGLFIIATLNTIYCLLTVIVVFFMLEPTNWGWAYFLLELAVVATLAVVEYRTAMYQRSLATFDPNATKNKPPA